MSRGTSTDNETPAITGLITIDLTQRYIYLEMMTCTTHSQPSTQITSLNLINGRDYVTNINNTNINNPIIIS